MWRDERAREAYAVVLRSERLPFIGRKAAPGTATVVFVAVEFVRAAGILRLSAFY
jgi:hypothetical protein